MPTSSIPPQVQTASGASADALRRQAALLARARHPGVLELLEVSEEGDDVTVLTAAVPGVSLDELSLAPPEAIGVLAVLATTIADLHDIGIVHGSVDGRHVRIGEDGRPVLVGFERASALTGNPREWPSAPAALTDVASLLALGRQLAGLNPGVREPSSSSSVRWRRAWSARAVGAEPMLALLVQRSRAFEVGAASSLTARALADRLVRDVPEARLPTPAPTPTPGSAPSDQRSAGEPVAPGDAADPWFGDAVQPEHMTFPRRRPVRVRALLGCTLVVVTLLVGHAALRRVASGPGHSSASAVGLIPHPPVRPATTGAQTTSYTNGVLRLGAARYALGQSGDLAVTGHFRCGAPVIVALLRPRTGQVWLFPRWPTPAAPVAAVVIGQVPGATGLVPRALGPCDEVLVTRPNAPAIDLRPWVTQ